MIMKYTAFLVLLAISVFPLRVAADQDRVNEIVISDPNSDRVIVLGSRVTPFDDDPVFGIHLISSSGKTKVVLFSDDAEKEASGLAVSVDDEAGLFVGADNKKSILLLTRPDYMTSVLLEVSNSSTRIAMLNNITETLAGWFSFDQDGERVGMFGVSRHDANNEGEMFDGGIIEKGEKSVVVGSDGFTTDSALKALDIGIRSLCLITKRCK